MDSERCNLLEQKWDELLQSAKEVVFYEEKLDQELFRETLYETWMLFKEGIDFKVIEEEYSLPIDLACIFARVHEYANLYQAFDYGKEADTIEVSATIVENLEWSIINRDFNLEKPIMTFRTLLFGNIYKLTYDLETGVLTIEDGYEEGSNDMILSQDGSMTLAKPRKKETIQVMDLAHWWEGVKTENE